MWRGPNTLHFTTCIDPPLLMAHCSIGRPRICYCWWLPALQGLERNFRFPPHPTDGQSRWCCFSIGAVLPREQSLLSDAGARKQWGQSVCQPSIVVYTNPRRTAFLTPGMWRLTQKARPPSNKNRQQQIYRLKSTYLFILCKIIPWTCSSTKL